MKKWQQIAAAFSAIASALWIMFTTFRAGVLYPEKVQNRFNSLEVGQSNLVKQVEALSYKQDRQHDLLIRIEERLWPEKTAALKPKEVEPGL